jgi:hypothetical protein
MYSTIIYTIAERNLEISDTEPTYKGKCEFPYRYSKDVSRATFQYQTAVSFAPQPALLLRKGPPSKKAPKQAGM